MEIITLPEFTIAQKALSKLIDKKPDWFSGVKNIVPVSNDDFYAAIKDDVIFLSASDKLTKGFKPAHALAGGIIKIQNKESLSFNEEYAIEMLWHELWHHRTHQAKIPVGKDRLILESFVQFTSRHSYHELMVALGAQVKYQEQIIRRGYAYQYEVSNFRALLKELKIDEKLMALALSRLLLENKEAGQLSIAVIAQLSRVSGIEQNKIQRALKLLTKPSGFIEKVRNLLDY